MLGRAKLEVRRLGELNVSLAKFADTDGSLVVRHRRGELEDEEVQGELLQELDRHNGLKEQLLLAIRQPAAGRPSTLRALLDSGGSSAELAAAAAAEADGLRVAATALQRTVDRQEAEQQSMQVELAASREEVTELRAQHEAGFDGDPAAAALHRQVWESAPPTPVCRVMSSRSLVAYLATLSRETVPCRWENRSRSSRHCDRRWRPWKPSFG